MSEKESEILRHPLVMELMGRLAMLEAEVSNLTDGGGDGSGDRDPLDAIPSDLGDIEYPDGANGDVSTLGHNPTEDEHKGELGMWLSWAAWGAAAGKTIPKIPYLAKDENDEGDLAWVPPDADAAGYGEGAAKSLQVADGVLQVYGWATAADAGSPTDTDMFFGPNSGKTGKYTSWLAIRTALAIDFAAANHDHSGTYSTIDHNHDDTYAPTDHNHDHGTLDGLSDDDHTQYALLGEAGGAGIPIRNAGPLKVNGDIEALGFGQVIAVSGFVAGEHAIAGGTNMGGRIAVMNLNTGEWVPIYVVGGIVAFSLL